MALLDGAHTTKFGHPTPTAVRLAPKKGKAILVSGHDLEVRGRARAAQHLPVCPFRKTSSTSSRPEQGMGGRHGVHQLARHAHLCTRNST